MSILSFNNFILGRGDSVLNHDSEPDPYNPLNLPPYTIRLKYSADVTPTFEKGTGTLIDQIENIWDLTYENSDWSYLLGDYKHHSLISVLGANTTDVTNMSYMFYYCDNLVGNMPLFDTSKVTNMDYMFMWAPISSIPKYNTSNVTSMNHTFQNTDITAVPYFDTSNVTSMSNLFINAEISSIPLLDTHNVVDMSYMLAQTHITSYPSFDTSNVTSMHRMFNGCLNLKYASYMDTSKVIYAEDMFYWCNELTNIPNLNTNKMLDIDRMFENCYNISSGISSLYNKVSTQQTIPSHSLTFRNCGISSTQGAAELAQIPDDWK